MPNKSSSQEEREQQHSQVVARGWTLLIANLGKLLGFAVVVNEVWIRQDIRQSAIGIAAVMVLGAQTTENVILKAIDRFFDGKS